MIDHSLLTTRWRAALLATASILIAAWRPDALAAGCTPSVATGFSGDLDAVYAGGGEGGGGGGGGGGAGSDAGAGAGEGKVLGGTMTITRIADGAVLGTAVTDGVKGLVTIVVCPTDLPVLFTLSGNPGAKYFDEGTNQLTDFGPGQVLHALVPTIDENIGVSPLTEAAYRYALNNYLRNPADVRAGRVPLASSGSVAGLTMLQVVNANNAILAEVNRMQTSGMRLTTIKSLPTPIDAASGSNALPANRYGTSAAVLGGLAAMANAYRPSLANPALVAGEQLARDLTDGKLDGFALDGSPAGGAAPIAYDPVRLPVAASVGANRVSTRFGASTTLANATAVAEFSTMGALNGRFVCDYGGDASALLRDGSVTVLRAACSNAAGPATTTLANFATGVRLLEGSGNKEVPRTFVVRNDGTVWGWGETLCGMLGNGEFASNFRTTPVQLAALRDVTSVAIGRYFALARDAGGSVWSWGLNYLGTLGAGSGAAAPGSLSCQNDYTSGPFLQEAAVATPLRIPGLANVVTVTADHITGYALDSAGAIWQWGLIPTGYDFNKPQPYYGEYSEQATPVKVAGVPKASSIAVSYYMKMALAADGTLWGWGPNIIGNFGDGTVALRLTPAQVPGIAQVVEIAGSGDSPFVALLQDNTIRYWGGCCTAGGGAIPSYVMKVPTAPVAGSTLFHSDARGTFAGTLPAIRHLRGTGGKVLLYGVDGSVYAFPKSDTEQVFVVVDAGPFGGGGGGGASNFGGIWWNAPANSESGWGLNLAHQGDTIFASWFTYDTNRKGWWLVMTAQRSGASTYTGTLYQTRGPAFNSAVFDPNAVAATPAGTGTLTFTDGGNGTFAYTVGGTSQTRSITRQVFGALPNCAFGAQPNLALAGNYQDLWWKSPAGSEAGWGINLNHQGDTIFATWFTYDVDGSPLWLVVTAPKTGPGTYAGDLYRTSGARFDQFRAVDVAATKVGTATFAFANGNSATFTYTVQVVGMAGPVTQSKAITREILVAPGTACQ